MLGRGQHDQEATAYVTAAFPRLMNLAGALTGNRHDAEDLVQDTMANVLIRWPKVHAAASPDAYVRRMMVNRFLSGKRLRSAKELVSHDAVTRDRPAPTGGGDLEARDAMMTLLWRLPRVQRTVLVLRFYEDLADAQIAEALGTREATVRSNVSRGLAKLRVLMEDEHTPESTERAQRRAVASHVPAIHS
ncbi:SigE family RNA polymerase sigma factor [Luteipulveratus sp. YIM 133132]|uniref:SigE family RNA polymerase sigma factor n=1 Tax=Luteipulveratus flavus TaxID=3031728 RepID=A0ABT6C6C8_9MICO|nr:MULTISPECIES: SigE family RNA polymerase sigma factor [unclassified Luteipulveratus]MDE9365183.1 SigE family RNA polymerase sigma factor [Luteipulveratus sp. YIM 133132]MDF8264481.1 SigE family RNA polymerase sigma factor [Luteipulveratus sp. YIM 133296]